MPKISVIIPVYNVEKYLPRCIESVLNQTFKDFEVICVNDGSPDNSATVLDNYSKQDERLKIITQENQGLSVARNTGFAVAVGEYVCFIDSDDSLHKQCLEIIYNLVEEYNADLVNFRLESVKLGSDREKYLLNKCVDIHRLDLKISDKPIFLGTHREKYKIDFNACGKLYKRSLLDGINFIPKIHFEDFPHTFAVLSKNPKTVVVNEVFYLYTVNDDSIFHQKNNPQQIKDYHIGINYIYDIYKQAGLHKELEFLVKNFIPNILQQQLARCRHAKKDMRHLMYEAFAQELIDLKKKGLIVWKYHRFFRLIKYFWIMKRFN